MSEKTKKTKKTKKTNEVNKMNDDNLEIFKIMNTQGMDAAAKKMLENANYDYSKMRSMYG